MQVWDAPWSHEDVPLGLPFWKELIVHLGGGKLVESL